MSMAQTTQFSIHFTLYVHIYAVLGRLIDLLFTIITLSTSTPFF